MSMKFASSHLAYCTNIHPAETWEETRVMLACHVLAVRERLRESGHLGAGEAFAIGLRLSAVAAKELLDGDHLARFRDWLDATNTYVFTINGFPYGSFHGTRVKEQVFRPDWSDPARLEYTQDLFRILAAIARSDISASVSTLPGSFKAFGADEAPIRRHLIKLAGYLDDLAEETGHDFHLGLEPEPLGQFEDMIETVGFFQRLRHHAPDPSAIQRRIGLNYDACHFSLEYNDVYQAFERFDHAGIRISKIHLSSALAFDPNDAAALAAIRAFNEPTYFHQVLLRQADDGIRRYPDLPEFLQALDNGTLRTADFREARVHFHIPLDAEPTAPLRSTRADTLKVLDWRRRHPEACQHYEIETYTWGVLPSGLQRPVAEQIAGEYQWVLANA
jgi:sugar phosphate isomerase/epimerase